MLLIMRLNYFAAHRHFHRIFPTVGAANSPVVGSANTLHCLREPSSAPDSPTENKLRSLHNIAHAHTLTEPSSRAPQQLGVEHRKLASLTGLPSPDPHLIKRHSHFTFDTAPAKMQLLSRQQACASTVAAPRATARPTPTVQGQQQK